MENIKEYRDNVGFILNNLVLTMEDNILCHDYMEIRTIHCVENININAPFTPSLSQMTLVNKMCKNGFKFKVNEDTNMVHYDSLLYIDNYQVLKEWKEGFTEHSK